MKAPDSGEAGARPAGAEDAAFEATLEMVPGFAELGFTAFTTTRATGDFSTRSLEPAREVLGRWDRLRTALGASGRSFVTAGQVHGTRILTHSPEWSGWLRADEADGHAAPVGGVGMAVTIADCTPVFIGHPSGAGALLHAGWRGTAAGIAAAGVAVLGEHGVPAAELFVHLGPSICGHCYEVGPEVHAALTGRTAPAPGPVDVRAVLADQLRVAGVRRGAITRSGQCTLCGDGMGVRSRPAAELPGPGERRYYSHRAGDAERQVAALGWAGNRSRSP